VAGDDVATSSIIFAGPNLICDSTASGDDDQVISAGEQPLDDRDGDGIDDRNVGTIQQQAGTIMHELGHNLGFRHGGNEARNFKSNYISIMNYLFQLRGIAPLDPDGIGPLAGRLDYSVADLPDLNENDLSELTGVGDCCGGQTSFCSIRTHQLELRYGYYRYRSGAGH